MNVCLCNGLQFVVWVILVNECPELTPPENGFHGCSDWHVGTFCQPQCNEGFGFYNNPAAEKYHCGDDGTWSPSGPLPKCYRRFHKSITNSDLS